MSAEQTQISYRVRQTFWSFGASCEKTFKTLPEAEAYGRAIAGGIAAIFYHRAGEYAGIPHRKPRSKNSDSGAASLMRLTREPGAFGDTVRRGWRFRVRAKMKWSELVDRIYQAAIEIEPIKKGSPPRTTP